MKPPVFLTGATGFLGTANAGLFEDFVVGTLELTAPTDEGDDFVFRKYDHDNGEKRFFGRKGNLDGDAFPEVPDLTLGPAEGTPGSNWTGLYFGGHIGYGFDPHDYSQGFEVAYNRVHHNGKHGIILAEHCVDSVIRDNIVYANEHLRDVVARPHLANAPHRDDPDLAARFTHYSPRAAVR